METATSTSNSRQCPKCGVKLTRYEWSRLWWMSGLMSGRLVQPCGECGVKLRMSSMALVSSAAALGLIVIAVCLYLYPAWATYLYIIALGLLLVILIAMLATRIEAVPTPTGKIEPPPERVGKKRLKSRMLYG
jgi:hypothetical protein